MKPVNLVDGINHAFTPACYRSGQTERLGRFSYRLAKRHFVNDLLDQR